VLKTFFWAQSRRKAMELVRERVAWRKPYVFVQTECGGGTAWSCSTETVWRMTGRTCQPLGAFIVTDESGHAGLALRGGEFHDLYDKLENAELPISHSRMPRFETVFVERDGTLVADLERTWRVNDEEFQKAFAAVQQIGTAAPSDEVERHEGPMADFAEALAIAKYCGKTSIVEELLARAREALTGDEADALERVVQKVTTGEVLARRRLKESCVA